MEDPSQPTKPHLVLRSNMTNASTYINLKTPTHSQIETKTPNSAHLLLEKNPNQKRC